jgi:hypothetical protein
MMIPNEPVIYRNFITEDERVLLKQHALDLLYRGELGINIATTGNYRNFKSFYKVDDLVLIHKELYHKIVNFLNLKEPVIDPFLGIIISVIKPGGFIHEHRDQYSKGNGFPRHTHMRNVRFNVVIDRGDDESYNPNINGVSYQVNKRDAWCFGASEIPHKTLTISGPENRIVYQFGFMMDAI